MNKYDEMREHLLKCGLLIAEICGDAEFGDRVLHAFEKYFHHLGDDLTGKQGYDIGAGKGAALIAALVLGIDFIVGIDRSFDEFAHDGYSKMSWDDVCIIYGVNSKKALFLRGEIPDTSFRGQPFDFVSLIDVIEHVPNPEVFINYAIEQLSDSGIILIDTCPLYFSPVGHHLFSYYDRKTEPWAHLRDDFAKSVIDKDIDIWSMDRFYELNKCTYGELKRIILDKGIFLVTDHCSLDEELLDLYELNKADIDPRGDLGAELLCREWILFVGQKMKNAKNGQVGTSINS